MTARMARLTLTTEELSVLGTAVEQMLVHFSHMKEIMLKVSSLRRTRSYASPGPVLTPWSLPITSPIHC